MCLFNSRSSASSRGEMINKQIAVLHSLARPLPLHVPASPLAASTLKPQPSKPPPSRLQIHFYNFNAPGFAENTGHFTQMIWADVSKIGCAANLRCNFKTWICQFTPAGDAHARTRPPTRNINVVLSTIFVVEMRGVGLSDLQQRAHVSHMGQAAA